jgi:hypothetical protein
MLAAFLRLMRDQGSAVEYWLIAVLIIVICMGAITIVDARSGFALSTVHAAASIANGADHEQQRDAPGAAVSRPDQGLTAKPAPAPSG